MGSTNIYNSCYHACCTALDTRTLIVCGGAARHFHLHPARQCSSLAPLLDREPPFSDSLTMIGVASDHLRFYPGIGSAIPSQPWRLIAKADSVGKVPYLP